MSVKLLQEKIGSTPDGIFGPNTLRKAMEFYKMTPERAAHFFAQTAHETGEYRLFSENLNYSSKGLQAVFGKYFPGNLEESYARQPEKIANRVYGNRMGNGDEESGDGWKYRGRGALQLTGKNNYKAFSEYLEKPEILDNPDLVTEEYAFESALFFFERNNLWSICDKGINEDSIKKLTRRINGGYNGLEHREKLTK
jgi:putative chitinase